MNRSSDGYNPFAGPLHTAQEKRSVGLTETVHAAARKHVGRRHVAVAVFSLILLIVATRSSHSTSPRMPPTVTAPQREVRSPVIAEAKVVSTVVPPTVSPPAKVGLKLPDDAVRMIIQVYGWAAVDGVQDDIGCSTLVVQPSVSTPYAYDVPRGEGSRVISFFAVLTDFATPSYDRNLPTYDLSSIVSSVPERVDVTTVVFHSSLQLADGSLRSLLTLSRVGMLLTSLALDKEAAWQTELKRAGYAVVSQSPQFKSWQRM